MLSPIRQEAAAADEEDKKEEDKAEEDKAAE